jgi:hypothetical protein
MCWREKVWECTNVVSLSGVYQIHHSWFVAGFFLLCLMNKYNKKIYKIYYKTKQKYIKKQNKNILKNKQKYIKKQSKIY